LGKYSREYKNFSQPQIFQRHSRLYALKKHKQWFGRGCSKLLDKKKSKCQWLQDPSEVNGYNMNNVRCEASRHFRNINREYLEVKSSEVAMNSKNKNMRDLYNGKKLI
jgi:hypothetical protein